MKKLSKKEREEVVTKGYLHDLLDERDYVTKSYLDQKLENYVTKDYLDKRFIKFRKEINQDFERHIGSLTEHYIDQLQTMFEGLDNRYVLRSELRSDRV